MAEKSNKIMIDIRTKLKVDKGSLEALMDKYLKDSEALPYEKYKVIIGALRTHYLPLIYEYQGASPEKLRQSLVDINRAWQIHFKYLQQRLGVDLTEEASPSHLSTPASIPITVPVPVSTNYYREQQYIEPQPQKNPEPETKPQLKLVTKHQLETEEEEGEYPDCFND